MAGIFLFVILYLSRQPYDYGVAWFVFECRLFMWFPDLNFMEINKHIK